MLAWNSLCNFILKEGYPPALASQMAGITGPKPHAWFMQSWGQNFVFARQTLNPVSYIIGPKLCIFNINIIEIRKTH